jgi:hypothetical protein
VRIPGQAAGGAPDRSRQKRAFRKAAPLMPYDSATPMFFSVTIDAQGGVVGGAMDASTALVHPGSIGEEPQFAEHGAAGTDPLLAGQLGEFQLRFEPGVRRRRQPCMQEFAASPAVPARLQPASMNSRLIIG